MTRFSSEYLSGIFVSQVRGIAAIQICAREFVPVNEAKVSACRKSEWLTPQSLQFNVNFRHFVCPVAVPVSVFSLKNHIFRSIESNKDKQRLSLINPLINKRL